MTAIFKLPDGSSVGTGLLMPTPEIIEESVKAPMYSENKFLDPKDIEKALKGDKYLTFRRMRQKLITNQGGLGQCNASATVAAFHNRRQLDGMAEVPLSSNHLYMNINGGQDGGSQLLDGLKYTAAKGVSPVQVRVNGSIVNFPTNVYDRRQVNQPLLKAADAAALTYQSFEAFRVPADSYANFRIAIASALAWDQQVIIALNVGQPFMNLRGGYIQQSPGAGNHALLAHSAKWVGGEDLVHADIQNSWGPCTNPLLGRTGGEGWGEGGFGLITMSSLWQCAKYHVFWVLPGTRLNPGAR